MPGLVVPSSPIYSKTDSHNGSHIFFLGSLHWFPSHVKEFCKILQRLVKWKIRIPK